MNSPTQLNTAPQIDSPRRLTVAAHPMREGEQDAAVRLEVGDANRNSIVLSIEEARALSLAIIAAVNKHEQHAHTRRKQAKQPVTLYPATR